MFVGESTMVKTIGWAESFAFWVVKPSQRLTGAGIKSCPPQDTRGASSDVQNKHHSVRQHTAQNGGLPAVSASPDGKHFEGGGDSEMPTAWTRNPCSGIHTPPLLPIPLRPTCTRPLQVRPGDTIYVATNNRHDPQIAGFRLYAESRNVSLAFFDDLCARAPGCGVWRRARSGLHLSSVEQVWVAWPCPDLVSRSRVDRGAAVVEPPPLAPPLPLPSPRPERANRQMH